MTDIIQENLYLFGDIVLFIIWLYFFLNRYSNKKEMLKIGFVFGVAAVIIAHKYALKDYWHPNYLIDGLYIEDFLYGFFITGICCQSPIILLHLKEKTSKFTHHSIAILGVLLSVLVFKFFVVTLSINSIYAHIAPLLLLGAYMSIMKPSYIKYQLYSGLLIVLITVFIYQMIFYFDPNFINNTFKKVVTEGPVYLGVPLLEYVFAFSLGYCVSVLYEYYAGINLVNRR